MAGMRDASGISVKAYLPHPVIRTRFITWLLKNMPEAYSVYDAWGVLRTKPNGVVIAKFNGKIVGVLRFSRLHSSMWAYGTFVKEGYRGKGVAMSLWRAALKKVKPRKVTVIPQSRGGQALVDALQKEAPGIEWETR